MTKDERVIARPKPFLVSVEKGKKYAWCACGRSKAQPFCDGSHGDTPIKPVIFTAEKTDEILLCGCKHTKAGPFCDGAHNNLQDTYEEATQAEIASMKNARPVARSGGDVGKATLDGGAYVLTPDPANAASHGSVTTLPLITGADGAQHLSFLEMRAAPGASSWMLFDESDCVLFVTDGGGAVNIEGASFDVGPEIGVFIKRGEAFRIEVNSDLRILAAICPQAAQVKRPSEPCGRFDRQLPERRVAVADAKSNLMADRFYQILVGEAVGSKEVTQFIGGVPKSRAAFHRHLYEEAIVILSGAGVMWTETRYAPVQPGDIIFLPARQGHSLECTADEGLRLMGVFYPSGSPAINY